MLHKTVSKVHAYSLVNKALQKRDLTVLELDNLSNLCNMALIEEFASYKN